MSKRTEKSMFPKFIHEIRGSLTRGRDLGKIPLANEEIATKQGKQPVREAVSYRGLFTAVWFGVREKHCSRLKIYDRLRASEQAYYF